MPAKAPSPGNVIACCSFCGKPDTMVRRLVAGPGVYICDECVELSAAIIADAAGAAAEEVSRRRAQYYDRPTEDVLAMLPVLVRSADRVESELAGWITRLRDRGTDWQAIADATGVTAEIARQRFEAAP